MNDEEQARLAEELNQYVEQLHLQGPIQPPANLTPEMRSVYDMATRFHKASAPIADPHPEFKGRLYQRLLAEMRAEEEEQLPFPPMAKSVGTQENHQPTYTSDAASTGVETEREGVSPPFTKLSQFKNIYKHNQVSQPAPASPVQAEKTDVKQRKRRGLSRRTLFTSGTIAASLAGAAIGAGIEYSLGSESTTEPPNTPDPHPSITGKAWHHVAPLDQLGTDPIRFTTDTITGYVIRQPDDSNEPVIAFSAACTHLGCTVQWQQSTRQFPCPCHGRRFDAVGSPVRTQSQSHYVPLPRLPRLEMKIENDNIYVKVPTL